MLFPLPPARFSNDNKPKHKAIKPAKDSIVPKIKAPTFAEAPKIPKAQNPNTKQITEIPNNIIAGKNLDTFDRTDLDT